jgi:membrane protein YqaA with SNARE-associated domain
VSLPVLVAGFHLSREFFISLGPLGVFAVAFLEFFLLPVPPDLVLIPLTVISPKFGPIYAVLATAGSVSAGLIGYIVGRKGGRRLLESRFSSERVGGAEASVRQYGFAVVFIGAFAPIPEGYELFSIAAGVFGLRPRTYLLASIVGRGGRYVLEVGLAIIASGVARSLTEVELYAVIGVVSVVIVGTYLLRDRWLPERWITR